LDHVQDSRVCPCCPVCVEVLRCADPPSRVSYRRPARSVISYANCEATLNLIEKSDSRQPSAPAMLDKHPVCVDPGP
jgi:hypothetical protein